MKASVLLGAGWEDDSLDVLWRDAGRAFCRIRRKAAESETHAFIPIPSGAEHPTPESVNRLAHEHDLQRYLDPSWAMTPLELVRERGQTLLVVDYTDGEPLDHLVRQPMEIGQFLRLGAALSNALGRLHGSGLIHKDLKPAHVVVGADTGVVRLTGFGIASRLPRERQAPEPPEFIAGTLAYLIAECELLTAAMVAAERRLSLLVHRTRTRDDVLDNITIAWLTNTAVSGARLYWEYWGKGYFDAKGVSIPVAVSVFPDELYPAPRSWAERAYPNLIHYNQLPKGGHFAAWEQPKFMSEEMRAGFRSLRQ